MRRIRLYINLILSVGMLAACASIPDKNVDPSKNNAVNFRKDLKECREDYPEAGSGVHIRQWEGCMNLKGWR
ncbi:hypothetical protein [Polynucleobacter sp. AP-Titi-500A-B4]|uniref:hypothetical protein n=1 Tax=Polynucleobacter sp. AP-Titi-500A-B4 TaxID=2576923 RepID=UPI001BFE6FC0|nr:hypothetical protein [Polynucleobacter sp. AP-Titi-500A-B4]QWE13640.1 hypothetical protein FD968_01550 [Polynucleobacter sp. AP-Titi-500A-B4]